MCLVILTCETELKGSEPEIRYQDAVYVEAVIIMPYRWNNCADPRTNPLEWHFQTYLIYPANHLFWDFGCNRIFLCLLGFLDIFRLIKQKNEPDRCFRYRMITLLFRILIFSKGDLYDQSMGTQRG